jgi:hypothetical protein
MFAPAFDHSFNDLFNQYVNTSVSTSGSIDSDVHFGNDFDQFFSMDPFANECGEFSPSESNHFQSSLQNWRKDDWTLQQESLGNLQLHRPEPAHNTVQPSEIVSGFRAVKLEEPSKKNSVRLNASPSSSPATPIRKPYSKSAPITPKNARVRKSTDRGTLNRKQSFSPSLIRATHLPKSKMAYPAENWTSRLQHLNNHWHGIDGQLPLSPPPSDILVQSDHVRRDSGVHMSSSAENLLQNDTEFAIPYTPTFCVNKVQQQPASFINQTSSTPPSGDDMFRTPPSLDSQHLHAWHVDALASNFHLTSDLNNHDGHWWSPPLQTRVSQPQAHNPSSVSSLGPKTLARHPSQPHQQQQQELLQGGLMIDFGPALDLGANADAFSSAASLHSMTATYIPTTSHQHNAFSLHPFIPAAQPTHLHQSFQKQPQTPSVSPTNTSSPKTRTPIKSNNISARRAHARKLSSNSAPTPKPVKLTTPTKNNSKGLSNVSFVNFTPNDSKKILTGVAPSGSSKTKARREQEAREKRRKLSEAAILAVRQAGGDVEALEAVLC